MALNTNPTPMSFLERFGHALDRAVHVIDRVEEGVTSSLLVIVIVINGMEIFAHSVLNTSLHWVYEINLLLANWIYYLGICLVYYKKKDIILEIVDKFMNMRRLILYKISINIIISVVLGVIIYYGWILLFIQAKTRTLGLGIPNFYFSMPVVIGSVSIILIVAKQSLDLWRQGNAAGRAAP